MLNQKYSIQKVFKLRNKLNDTLSNYAGVTLEARNFECLVFDVLSDLPKVVGFNTVFKSLLSVVGKKLTTEDSFDLAWRLAGNLPLLRAGVPVLPWTGQS